MADLAHALDGRAVSRAAKAGDLQLQAQKLDALRAALDPLPAAFDVVLDATQQVVGDLPQRALINVLDEVIEPAALFPAGPVNEALAVDADRDRAVVMLNAQDWLVAGLHGRNVASFHHNVRSRDRGLGQARQANVLGREAGHWRHGYCPSTVGTGVGSISSTKRRIPSCAAIVSDWAIIS